MKNYSIFITFLVMSFFTWKSCQIDDKPNEIITVRDTIGLNSIRDSIKNLDLLKINTMNELNQTQAELNEKQAKIGLLKDKINILKKQYVHLKKNDIKFKIRDTSLITINNYIRDTFYIKDSLIQKPNPFSIEYADRGLSVNVYGFSENDIVAADSMNISINGVVGIEKINDSQFKAFFSSPSPLLNKKYESDIYTIEKPKQKRFGIGTQIGVGFNSTLQVKPYIGFGIQYNLFQF